MTLNMNATIFLTLFHLLNHSETLPYFSKRQSRYNRINSDRWGKQFSMKKKKYNLMYAKWHVVQLVYMKIHTPNSPFQGLFTKLFQSLRKLFQMILILSGTLPMPLFSWCIALPRSVLQCVVLDGLGIMCSFHIWLPRCHIW